jgi:hypothetical protein
MPGMDHILAKAFLATGGAVAYPAWSVVSQVAAVGLTPAACVLTPTTAGTAGAGSTGILGVCQEQLDAVKTVTGKAFINVALEGNVKAIWDGTGTPVLGGYVVPSSTIAGRVKFVTSVTTFQGYALVGTCLSLPGSPLPTFGSNGAAGDLFDIALSGIGERI